MFACSFHKDSLDLRHKIAFRLLKLRVKNQYSSVKMPIASFFVTRWAVLADGKAQGALAG